MDSDLEDKIMSMVQYGSGIAKKKAPTANTQDDSNNINDAKESNVEAKIVYAPTDIDDEGAEKTAFSSANEFQIDDTDSEDDTNLKPFYSDEESSDEEEDIGVPELTADVPIKKDVEQPQVTRFINMDDEDKRYLDDEETSEEETELGIKLQKLIDDQVGKNFEWNIGRILTSDLDL
jgi:prolyl-tRNA synthetase